MSIEYCKYCDKHIDTDFNAEHLLAREDPKWGEVVDGCIESRSDMKNAVSRGFANAMCAGFMFWLILALIFIM